MTCVCVSVSVCVRFVFGAPGFECHEATSTIIVLNIDDIKLGDEGRLRVGRRSIGDCRNVRLTSDNA